MREGAQAAGKGEATGLILAGGRSSRMGRDKLIIDVGGTPLAARVHAALAPSCGEIITVGDGPEVVAGARRVRDLRGGREGPLAGMEAGLGAASFAAVFVAAGDMPFVPPDLVSFMLDRLRSRGLRAVAPRHDGRLHPLCAAYDRGVLPEVSRLLDDGTRAAWRLVEAFGEGVGYIEEELREFGDPDVFLTNVNSPEDLLRAQEMHGREG